MAVFKLFNFCQLYHEKKNMHTGETSLNIFFGLIGLKKRKTIKMLTNDLFILGNLTVKLAADFVAVLINKIEK